MSAETAEVCQFHGYRLDLVRRQLLDPGGAPVPLTPKAVETLVHLVMRAGQTVTKDELLRAVWPETVVEENNLTQNISALRKAFGEKLGEHRFIVTIPGRGYRFVAPVSRLDRPTAILPEAPLAPAPPEQAVRRRLLTVIAALVLVAAGVIAWRLPSLPSETPPPNPQTIAILPFKPVVEEHRNEAMELGMADSLIMELSRSEHLIVRPLNVTRGFVALDQDPLEAGRTLAVDAVVDGTIQVGGDRIRTSARLLSVADGRQLWAGKFDEKFSDIFQVQDAIAQRVAEALEIRLNPRSQPQTEDVRAYELYMRGRLHAMRLVLPEVRRGIEYYEQSIAADPSYALPYSGIADAMRASVLSNDARPSEMAPRAKAAARRAIELAPDLSAANYSHGMIAFWFDWDWAAAEKDLWRAVELAPNEADAQIYLAHLHSNLGRKKEALVHARRASELNPVSPLIGALEGQFLSYHGEHEAAIRKLRETISLEPRFWLSHHTLANALIETGQYEESIQESQEAKQLSPLQTYSDALIAVALARSGRPDDARALLKILTETARERYVPPMHFALIEAALGNRDAAIAQLEASRSVGDVRLTYLKIEPKLDDLRDDPRFRALLSELNF